MTRMLLLVIAVSFLSTGAALADSETGVRKEAPAAETNLSKPAVQPTVAKAPADHRVSTRDRWRGRPYLRGVAIENAERDIQLMPVDQPIPRGGSAEGSTGLRAEALNKSLHFAVSAGGTLPF
ncbi:MAG: hypothetical protein GY723_04855 [bacterium]|nr:hypothetical protein [bacterium]MCP5069903.1 hypothetical protein [bacterium]